LRSNTVFVLLILMLGGLVAGVALRSRPAHVAPAIAEPTGSATATTSAASATASATVSATASGTVAPATSGSAAPADGPSLKRPIRVVSLGWELIAAGVMANDGADPGKNSAFKAKHLDVHLTAVNDASKLENALARGGKDDKGADIAIMSLPRFVASYERLKALTPVIFFVVGWSDGHEVVMSKKKSFEDLPARGKVKMRGAAGSAAAFVGLYALDLQGVDPERVELIDDKADWMSMTRRKSKSKSEQVKANLLLTTAEASRLVPYVAIAQASMIKKHEDVLETWAAVWLDGHNKVAADASEAARKIAEAKGAPEPLAVLSNLGQIAPASLAENATAAGLSGRGAVTLESLFQTSWDVWRRAKVLTIPPENAPVNGRVIAALVRAGGDLDVPQAGSKGDKPDTGGKPLIVKRLPRGKLDQDALIDEIAFVAGVFRRSPIRVTVHPHGIVDKKKSKAAVDGATSQFGLATGRLLVGKARSKAGSIATIEVMPVP
jgi:hypothetical protein